MNTILRIHTHDLPGLSTHIHSSLISNCKCFPINVFNLIKHNRLLVVVLSTAS